MAVVVEFEMAGVIPEVVLELGRRMDVQANPPHGLIVHTALQVAGGVRIVDVWASEADYRKFTAERLGPVMGQLAKEQGMDAPTPAGETVSESFDLVHPHVH